MNYKDILESIGEFSKNENINFKNLRDNIKCEHYHCDGTR